SGDDAVAAPSLARSGDDAVAAPSLARSGDDAVAAPSLARSGDDAVAAARSMDGSGRDAVVAAARALAGRSAGIVVVKRGALGALAWSADGPMVAPGVSATPVDTVGAGDSFNAGFLAGRLGGADLESSLRLAAACGALSTRAAGGTDAQPTLSEARSAWN
ncbi:PfkB family carbohydrate kinase, partial [Asanoa sp. NPDC049573]|uniref:carbohydrate kinase family protein n=1 Tax=Asanoa sp. NPDC049573 TaxID=3155396 RepID=UPI00343702BB